jgi:DNA mismatch endonuclease (patch repair protein)
MQAIRHRNTKPEILVRQLLHARGFRFRLNVTKLPGTPDIVLPKYRAVIFVNGCFWHGHDCYLFRLPKIRQDFWETKINANCARDVRARTALLESGWRVLTIWECGVKGRLKIPPDQLSEKITQWLLGNSTEESFRYTELSCHEEESDTRSDE